MFELNIDDTNIFSTKKDPQTGNHYTYKKFQENSQVEVHDSAGKLLYEGPYNSDADKASVPDKFREFIGKLYSDILLKKDDQ